MPTLQYRFGAWQHALNLIREQPLLGTGLGTFRFAFMRYAPPGEGWWTTADNEYVELVCDTGLAGAAVFLVGLGAWLFLVARPGAFRGGTRLYVWIGIVSGMLGLLAHSAVSSNLQVPANGLTLTVLGGALLAVMERGR